MELLTLKRATVTISNLRYNGISSLQSSFDPLRRFIGVFDGRLEEIDGKLWMHLRSNPCAILFTDTFISLKL